MSAARAIRCVRCGERKPREHFVNDRTRSGGKFPWCKPCVIEARRETREQEKQRIPMTPLPGMEAGRTCPVCEVSLDGTHTNRGYCSASCKGKARRIRMFGLEPAEYRQLIASQNGRCPICGKRVNVWQLDHDHATGETTGPTCTTCNVNVLAYVKHDPAIAANLLRYLENPPVRVMFGERRYIGPESVSQLHRMWGWTAKVKAAES